MHQKKTVTVLTHGTPKGIDNCFSRVLLITGGFLIRRLSCESFMLTARVLGAGRHVGRSACLVQIENYGVLFDCGIQVTNKGASRFPNFRLLFELRSPSSLLINDASKENPAHVSSIYRCLTDIVLITHFHLDHVGALPFFTEVLGYDGPVLMTPATFAQAKLQLEDCWLNKNNACVSERGTLTSCERLVDRFHGEIDESHDNNATFEEGEICHEPVTTYDIFSSYWTTPLDQAMIDACLSKVTLVPFSQSTVLGNLCITALPAGHVPGACMFQVEGLSTRHSVLYTGDFTTDGEQVIPIAQVPSLHPTLLVSEGTYGSQVRDSKRAMEREICCLIETVVRRKGKVLLPMPGVGKTQELAILLAMHWKACGIQVPIVLSTGIMEKALQVLKKSTPHWVSNDLDIYDYIYCMDVKRVLQLPHNVPVVYFCSPRSLQAGPSLQVFRKWGASPQNLIILVGFSLPGTLAYEIIKGTKCLTLPPSADTTTDDHDVSHDKFVLHAKMRYFSLGSHADSLAIQNFVAYASPLVTMVVHGEEMGLCALARQLNKTLRRPCWAPNNDDVIVVHMGPVPFSLNFHSVMKALVNVAEQRTLPFLREWQTEPKGLEDVLNHHLAVTNKWVSTRWSRCNFKSLRQMMLTQREKVTDCRSLLEKWCPQLVPRLASDPPLRVPIRVLEHSIKEHLCQKTEVSEQDPQVRSGYHVKDVSHLASTSTATVAKRKRALNASHVIHNTSQPTHFSSRDESSHSKQKSLHSEDKQHNASGVHPQSKRVPSNVEDCATYNQITEGILVGRHSSDYKQILPERAPVKEGNSRHSTDNDVVDIEEGEIISDF